MSDSTMDALTTAPARRTPMWLVATIAGAFGLFYAYALWNALALLVAQATAPSGLSGYGWFVLLLPVVFPIGVFAGALALGSKRAPHHLLLIMLTGLALVAVFWLNIVAYALVLDEQLLG